jgi:glutaredoxin
VTEDLTKKTRIVEETAATLLNAEREVSFALARAARAQIVSERATRTFESLESSVDNYALSGNGMPTETVDGTVRAKNDKLLVPYREAHENKKEALTNASAALAEANDVLELAEQAWETTAEEYELALNASRNRRLAAVRSFARQAAGDNETRAALEFAEGIVTAAPTLESVLKFAHAENDNETSKLASSIPETSLLGDEGCALAQKLSRDGETCPGEDLGCTQNRTSGACMSVVHARIVTREGCPWCAKAKTLLREHGIKFREENADDVSAAESSTWSTVPQVFTGHGDAQKHIGGFDDLAEHLGATGTETA